MAGAVEGDPVAVPAAIPPDRASDGDLFSEDVGAVGIVTDTEIRQEHR